MSRYTLATSIFNRFTGVALSLGLLPLVYWLIAVSGGPLAYAQGLRVLTSAPAKIAYAAFIVSFAYHLIAGIRHLVWDTGRGLERAQSRRSAYLVVVASLALMLMIAYCAWAATVRAP
jgi:succinate dehydrogenase / fumarate reductase, cytochrome b subunit